MSTLYGTLTSQASKDYELQTSALQQNKDLVNQFGEEMESFGLTPHVKPADRSTVKLVAGSARGQPHEPIFEALRARGYRVDEPVKPATQLTDGFTIWTVNVHGSRLSFTLLFYTVRDVA
jgi:hypothetical protein